MSTVRSHTAPMPNDFLDRHSEPAPRPVRRRWGFIVVTIVVVVSLWAAGKHFMSGGLANAEIEEGTRQMFAGVVAKDPALFEQAEDHLVDAASVSPVDRYPVFLIRTNRRLKGWAQGEALDDPVAAALAARDYSRARRAAAEVDQDQVRVYWRRIIERFESLDEGGV